MMRDLFPNLPIVLHKVGSNCCEDFFSFLGQHVKNKHNFCIGEAIEETSHIRRTKQIKFEGDGPLFMNQDNKIFFGVKVMRLVLLIILIMIQFQIEL